MAMTESTRRRRILLVTEAGGGVARHLIDLAGGLRARGFCVHLLYSTIRMDSRFRQELEELENVTLAQVSMHRSPHPTDLGAVAKIRSYVKKNGPFWVVHGHSSKGGALVRLAAGWSTVTIVYTPHAFRTQDPALSWPLRLLFGSTERFLSGITDGIIVLSREEQEHARRLGISPKKLYLVHNGLKATEQGARPVRREDFGLTDEQFVIGFVGRLCHQKAPERLLRVLHRLVRDLPKVRLLMVGSGPDEGMLRSYERELGVGDKIVWLGDVEGARLMRLFDVFVMPSRYEGMPYVLLEALASDLPIVATNVGGVAEVVAEGENGFIVPQEETARMEEALRVLITDQGLRERMRTEARRRLAAFSVEEMLRKTVDVYSTASRSNGVARGR